MWLNSNQWVAFQAQRNGKTGLELLNLKTNQNLRLIDATDGPKAEWYVFPSPDGKLVAVVSTGSLYVASRDAGWVTVRPPETLPPDGVFPIWSPNSTTLAWIEYVNDKEVTVRTLTPDMKGGAAEKNFTVTSD